MKRGRLKSRNPARKIILFARDFGEESVIVRAMQCAVPGCGHGPIECAHNPSRGANGGRFDQGPLCKPHHVEQTNGGVLSFQDKYSIDLRELWDEIAIGHERPLGLVTVADNWWRMKPMTDYESDAIAGWTRRAIHRDVDVVGVGLSLDIGLDEARRLMEWAA